MEHEILTSNFSNTEQVEALYFEFEKELLEYVDQLMWWNNRVNLVSRDVSRETVKHHIEHSLVISQLSLFQNSLQIIDAGAGGGFPGLPLGITHPKKEILLNDIVSKKMMACKQMVLKLGLDNISTQAGSIADVEVSKKSLIVSKHAFKINDLIEMLGQKEWSGIVLLKGRDEVEQELNGVKTPLNINIISLEAFRNSFYDGKALVEITRR